MKTILAALAVTVGIVSVALPASAGYVSPNANWQTKAFTNGVP